MLPGVHSTVGIDLRVSNNLVWRTLIRGNNLCNLFISSIFFCYTGIIRSHNTLGHSASVFCFSTSWTLILPQSLHGDCKGSLSCCCKGCKACTNFCRSNSHGHGSPDSNFSLLRLPHGGLSALMPAWSLSCEMTRKPTISAGHRPVWWARWLKDVGATWISWDVYSQSTDEHINPGIFCAWNATGRK